MPDSFSDTSMLTDEERELVQRMRADNERVARERRANPGRRGGLSPEKQDFPIGIRPDGSLNRVEDAPDPNGAV